MQSFEALTGMEALLPNLLTWLLSGGFTCLTLGPLHRLAHDLTAGFPQLRDAKERETKVEVIVPFIIQSQSDIQSLLLHSIGHTDQP